jgi:hypothetical protein
MLTQAVPHAASKELRTSWLALALGGVARS